MIKIAPKSGIFPKNANENTVIEISKIFSKYFLNFSLSKSLTFGLLLFGVGRVRPI